MAKELAQGGQDIALKALTGAALAAKKTWIVLCTASASADRVVTATEVYTNRFTGCPAIQSTDADWGAPTGSSPNARVITNTSAISSAAVSGLGSPATISHYAAVQTSDDLVPSGTNFPNISAVVYYGALTASKTGVDNGDVVEFAASSLTISVD